MRTQFHFVGLLGLVAGGLVATAGCDNITAGQQSEQSAPPQLQHVMIQDARYLGSFPNRASALDLLDNNPFVGEPCQITCKGNCPAGPGTTPAPAQLDTCVTEFLVDQVSPNVACKADGTCTDPLKVPSTGIPVPLPATLIGAAPDNRDPGGGIQVRLVFDKVLNTNIETVTMDPTKAPGKTNKYALMPGIVELDDAAGMPVPSVQYLENGGSPIYSADLEFVPLGPAIVIKPKAPLDASTTYTVKIGNGAAIQDRTGQAATGLGGGALPTSFKFTTEALTAAADGAGAVGFASSLEYPDFTMPSAMITPNEVVQIGFFENIAGDTATVTVMGPAGVKAIAFSDRGADPTMCTKSDSSGNVLDIVNTDTGVLTTAMPVDWPLGAYTITISVKDINGKSPAYTNTYKFTVAGTDVTDATKDPNIAAAHVTPAACAMP